MMGRCKASYGSLPCSYYAEGYLGLVIYTTKILFPVSCKLGGSIGRKNFDKRKISVPFCNYCHHRSVLSWELT